MNNICTHHNDAERRQTGDPCPICQKLEIDQLRKCEWQLITLQKRYADDVAELNARLIQRREDYAAHSVKQAQEMQSLRAKLEDVDPLLDDLEQLKDAEYNLHHFRSIAQRAYERFTSKHPRRI